MQGLEAIVAQLDEVGIRVKLEMVERGTFVDSCKTGKYRGLVFTVVPWWAGRSHPFTAWASTTIAGSYVATATEEMKEATYKTQEPVTEEGIAEAAKEAETLFHTLKERILLWSCHEAFALGPKVKTFEPVPGMNHVVGWDRIKLAD